MKATATVLAISFARAQADPDQETLQGCMNCYDYDRNSGFGKSWSWCASTDECVENVWNYMNRECKDP